MNSEYLLNHVRKRFADKSFNVQCWARELDLSESYLREFINVNFNTDPQHLIETIRLEAAIRLIYKNDVSLYTVCSESGYSNQKTFRQAFKRRLKKTPQELRKVINNSKDSFKDCEDIIKEIWDSMN